MNGVTHLSGGVLTGVGAVAALLASNLINPCGAIVFSAACMFGSLFPDIDNKSSILGRPCFFLRPFQGAKSHRNKITHTPIGAFLSSSILLYFTRSFLYIEPLLAGFVTGYVLHLLMDSMTAGGIRWFYPSKKKISLRHVPSGSNSDVLYMVIVSLVIIFIYFFGCHIASTWRRM